MATHEPNLGTLNQTAKNVILALNYNKSSMKDETYPNNSILQTDRIKEL